MNDQLTPDQQRLKERIDAAMDALTLPTPEQQAMKDVMAGLTRAAEAMVPVLEQFAASLAALGARISSSLIIAALERERARYPDAYALADEYYAWRIEQGLDECQTSVRFGMVPPSARCAGVSG